MTTIAWDGQTLAADRQGTIGNLKTSCTKIFRLRDGRLFGGAGEHQDSLLVRDWLNGGERPSDVGEGFSGIVIALEAVVHRLENKLVLDPVEERFYAIGSGSPYALMAMDLGKDAREAVARTSRYDPNTGTEIDTLRLKKPRGK